MKGENDTGHSFSAYFKRATSPLVVLRILMDHDMYVYEMVQEMQKRSGGLFKIAVLYPVIYRLEEQGFVQITRSEVVDGRARSYYGITQNGRAYYQKTIEEYRQISAVFQAMTEERGETDAYK